MKQNLYETETFSQLHVPTSETMSIMQKRDSVGTAFQNRRGVTIELHAMALFSKV